MDFINNVTYMVLLVQLIFVFYHRPSKFVQNIKGGSLIIKPFTWGGGSWINRYFKS
jgi:hypothetical protein